MTFSQNIWLSKWLLSNNPSLLINNSGVEISTIRRYFLRTFSEVDIELFLQTNIFKFQNFDVGPTSQICHG